jgi:hypothetical protein
LTSFGPSLILKHYFWKIYHTDRGVMSSFFYLAERLNPDMIYCGAAPPECLVNQTSIDTSLCTIDSWGVVDCSSAGCPPQSGGIEEPCWNLYRSIISSSFWTLNNLFGEFPLVGQHSAGGQVLGTITAVFACAVFSLAAGIFGSGFENEIAKRREAKQAAAEAEVEASPSNVEMQSKKVEPVGDSSTLRGSVYNFLHLQTSTMGKLFEVLMNGFIIGTTIVFMLDTVTKNDALAMWHAAFDVFQKLAAIIFTVEYVLFMYSAAENPKYGGSGGLFTYAKDFLRVFDLLSIAPFWLTLLVPEHSSFHNFAKLCLLLRLFRFEKYSKAFTTFDDVIRENMDVLTVTGFSAMLLW